MKKDRMIRSVSNETWQKLKVFSASNNTTFAESLTLLLAMNQDFLFTLNELNQMDTLSESQFDDLKFESRFCRVWLSRMTIEDGMPYNNQVSIECLEPDGQWKIKLRYQAK